MENSGEIEIIVNGEPMQIEAGASIADLLVQLKIEARAIAVELNEEIQSLADFSQQILEGNDVLEVVTLVGGG